MVVCARFQTTFFEVRLDLLRIPRIDAPCEAVVYCLDLRPFDAKACIGDRCRRRGGQSAANYDAAGVFADIEHRLLAVVATHAPIHQGCVPRRGFLVVNALVVEMIEPHTLPTGRLKRKFKRRGRRLLPAALASALGLPPSTRLLRCGLLAEDACRQRERGSGKRKEISARK